MLTGITDATIGEVMERGSGLFDMEKVDSLIEKKKVDAKEILSMYDIKVWHYTTANSKELDEFGLQSLDTILRRSSELTSFLSNNGIAINFDENYIQYDKEKLNFNKENKSTTENNLIQRLTSDYNICGFANEDVGGIRSYNSEIESAPELLSTIEKAFGKEGDITKEWIKNKEHELKKVMFEIPISKTSLIREPEDSLGRLIFAAAYNHNECKMNDQVIVEILGAKSIKDIEYKNFISLEREERDKCRKLAGIID